MPQYLVCPPIRGDCSVSMPFLRFIEVISHRERRNTVVYSFPLHSRLRLSGDIPIVAAETAQICGRSELVVRRSS